MTETFEQDGREQAGHGDTSALVALARRLPRMITVTAIVVGITFLALQFWPRQFLAQMTLDRPTVALGEDYWADIVSRLSPEAVAELRRNGEPGVDTLALLRKSIELHPDSSGLHLAARAGTAPLAEALARAAAASLEAMSETPAPPPLPLDEARPPDMPAAPAVSLLEDGGVEQLRQQLSIAWQERVRLESRSKLIDSLIANDNLSMLALEAEKLPGLGRRLDELASLEAEQERLSATLLPNHPNMRLLKEQIDGLEAELAEEAQKLADLVRTERDARRLQEDELRAQLASALTGQTDGTIVTGAIGRQNEPIVAALPPPIRADFAMILAGALSLGGQLGFFAWQRRRQRTGDVSAPDLEFEDVQDLPAGWAEGTRMEEDMVDNTGLPDADLSSGAQEAVAVHLAPRPPEPAKPDAVTARDGAGRILIVRSSGNANGARKLLMHYRSNGKRTALVDAASRRRTAAPGISDLSMNLASFADIIHGSGIEEAAYIPWGRQAQFDPNAPCVRTLVRALAALYDIVILAVDDGSPRAIAPLLALAEEEISADTLAEAA